MRNFTLIMAMALALLSCEKDPMKEPASDFVLKRYREYPGGNSTLDVERALNLDETTSFNAKISKVDADLVLELGGNKVNTVDPKLSATIIFKGKSDPQSIIGTYDFPGAYPGVDIYFFEHTPTGFTGTSIPASGRLVVGYDAASNSYNGSITDLKYNIPFRAEYTFEKFDATFKQVKFR
jgi:hypothetical protein